MSLKSEKLTKATQDLQQIVARWLSHDPRSGAIAQSLKEISSALEDGKLTLQIMSRYPEATHALQSFLDHQSLSQAYHVRSIRLSDEPKSVEPEAIATLRLQSLSGPQSCEELSILQTYRIGRRPGCQILIPNSYLQVSGYHATLEAIPARDSYPAPATWWIRDSSRNGTYVNGQLVQEPQKLEDGDRIMLGCPYPTEACPELIFNHALRWDEKSKADQETDCDVFCLMIDLDRGLMPSEKQIIRKAKQAQIAKRFIIIAVEEDMVEAAQAIQNRMTEVKTLFDEDQESGFEVLPVSFRGLTPPPHPESIDAVSQRNLNQFCKLLTKLVERRPEDTLAKRLRVNLSSQINLIERNLSNQKKSLEMKNQRAAVQLKGVGKKQLKSDLDQRWKQIDKNRSAFFKQVSDDLERSKQDLLDEFLEKGISARISQFTRQLEVEVIKRGRQKYIQLRSPAANELASENPDRENIETSVDANTALMNFCRAELCHWANEEWTKILDRYGEGGLQGFFEGARQTLDELDFLELSNLHYSPLQLTQIRDLQPIFEAGFTKPSCEVSFKEASPVGYILKKIRSQWMQFIFMFSFFSILGIAGRRQIMRYITAPIIDVFKAFPWISTLVLLVLLWFLFKLLTRIYYEDRDAEREKQSKKLRDDLCSHYQAIAKKRLVDKLMQNLNLALKSEEERLKEILQTAKQCIEASLEQFQQDQALIQSLLEQNMQQWKELEQEQRSLQKLKL